MPKITNQNTSPIVGTTAPTLVTPTFIGQNYVDTTNLNVYVSYGTGVGEWINESIGVLEYIGAYDASVNTYPATGGSGPAGAIVKGDMWIISVAGTLGGESVHVGDSIIANTDTPGQTAANWDSFNGNISYVPEDVANKVTSISAASTDTEYPSAKLAYDQLALKVDKVSSTDNALPKFDGTTGDIQNSAVIVDDSNNIYGIKSLGLTGTRIASGWFTDVDITNLPTINGGTLATALSLGTMASETATNYVAKSLFDANTILYATTDNTPVALNVAEQSVVGRLTGGAIDDIAIGIADNNIVQIDDASVADNDYVKFTANGIKGVPYSTVLSDIGAQAALGFTPEDSANKVTSFQSTPDDTNYPSEKLVKEQLDLKIGGDTSYGGTVVTNLDTITKTGFYTCYGNATGVPDEDYSWFVLHQNSNVGTVSATQRAIAYNTEIIVYERSKQASTWGSWHLNSSTEVLELTDKLINEKVGKTVNVTTVNEATYDLLESDYILNVTYTTTGAVTSITLPTAQTVKGRVVIIKDAGLNATTNSITINAETPTLIEGISTYTINTNGGSVTLYADGTNWFII